MCGAGAPPEVFVSLRLSLRPTQFCCGADLIYRSPHRRHLISRSRRGLLHVPVALLKPNDSNIGGNTEAETLLRGLT